VQEVEGARRRGEKEGGHVYILQRASVHRGCIAGGVLGGMWDTIAWDMVNGTYSRGVARRHTKHSKGRGRHRQNERQRQI